MGVGDAYDALTSDFPDLDDVRSTEDVDGEGPTVSPFRLPSSTALKAVMVVAVLVAAVGSNKLPGRVKQHVEETRTGATVVEWQPDPPAGPLIRLTPATTVARKSEFWSAAPARSVISTPRAAAIPPPLPQERLTKIPNPCGVGFFVCR